MKKLNLLFTFAFVALFTACSQEGMVQEPQELKSVDYQLASTEPLEDQTIINQLQPTMAVESTTRGMSLDMSRATISSYKEATGQMSPVRSIVIPVRGQNLSYIKLVKDGKLSKENMFISVRQEGGVYKASYFDSDKELLGGIEVKDGVVVNAFGVKNQSGQNESGIATEGNGWGRAFGTCVKANALRMADGSVSGAAYFLGCMVVGPECALGIGFGCWAAATYETW